MFGPDPINLFDPSPYLPISYYGHVFIGLLCIAAALVAFLSKKGGRIHVRAGRVFIIAALIVCLTSASMLFDVYIPPLFMASVSASYVVLTAYLALQKPERWVRISEYGLALIELAAVGIFLADAVPNAMAGNIPMIAPFIIIAIPLILLAGDANWFLNQKNRAQLRVRRHIARMVWGIVIIVRAPLVELAAGGVPIPTPLLLFGPFPIALALIYWFHHRHGKLTPA